MNIDLQARQITPLRHNFAHVAQHLDSDKPASRYQEATLGAQPSTNFHYRPTWDPAHMLFDAHRSAVALDDWYTLRDPRQYYYASWTMARARQQDAMEANAQFVEQRGLAAQMHDEARALACAVLLPLRHVAWGANLNNCSIAAYGYGAAFTAPAMFHAMDHLGIAQYLTRLGLSLDSAQALEAGRRAWLDGAQWQVLRRCVEDSLVLRDPFELFVAQNLALDGLLYPLIYDHFVDDHLCPQGGTAVAMLTAFMPDWFEDGSRWVDAVVKTAAAASPANRQHIREWALGWAERAQAALAPVADLALGDHGQAALAEVRSAWDARTARLGLD